MKTTTHRFKLIGTPILLLILLITQTLTIGINNWTTNYFIQALLLDVFILIGIYAFRGFEYDKSTNMNSCFVAFLTGTTAGILASFIPILLFFTPRLPQTLFITTIISAAVINPLIFCISMKAVIKSLPVKKFLVIGKQAEIEPIFKEIEERAMGKIKAYRYMNPSAIALEREITYQPAFDQILIADPMLEKTVISQIQKAKRQGIEINYLPQLAEDYLQRIPIPILKKFEDYYEIILNTEKTSKSIRVLDLFFSLVLMVIFIIPFLISCLLILIIDGKPIFYSQERLGYKRKKFKILKLRTMVEKDDKLVMTKTGNFLRKTRMNEIPQLFNILKGDLSLVGPRPDLESFFDMWIDKIPYYDYRYNIPSGVTGHAQVRYGYVETKNEYQRRLEYDLYYIANYNIMLYAVTLLRTVETIIFRRGAK